MIVRRHDVERPTGTPFGAAGRIRQLVSGGAGRQPTTATEGSSVQLSQILATGAETAESAGLLPLPHIAVRT